MNERTHTLKGRDLDCQQFNESIYQTNAQLYDQKENIPSLNIIDKGNYGWLSGCKEENPKKQLECDNKMSYTAQQQNHILNSKQSLQKNFKTAKDTSMYEKESIYGIIIPRMMKVSFNRFSPI
jgi:hypothetical protein